MILNSSGTALRARLTLATKYLKRYFLQAASIKSIQRDPTESVGVLAMKNGQPAVVEYSELPKELAYQRDDSGALVYCAANIAIHCLSVDFLQKIVDNSLPYHLALKKIPYIGPDGYSIVKPSSINGIKLEMFIFDSLSYSTNPGAFFVSREGNFSPVKNASAPGVLDSPETARRDLYSYHMKLAEKSGAVFEFGNQIFYLDYLI